jgi:ribosomal protein S18 acetylase RimI-like enzyme
MRDERFDAISSQEMSIRPMRSADIPEVVRIHLESFPGFFLTFLGIRFLRLLYDSIAAAPEGVVLVACDRDGTISGFAAGVTQQSGFYSRLLRRRKWRFAMASFGALLRRPTIVPRLLGALHRPEDAEESSVPACLMSISVRPSARGIGAGRALVDAFGSELRARGVRTFCLTTDRDDNDDVNDFYRRSGFTLQRSFVTREGRPMSEYVMRIR